MKERALERGGGLGGKRNRANEIEVWRNGRDKMRTWNEMMQKEERDVGGEAASLALFCTSEHEIDETIC